MIVRCTRKLAPELGLRPQDLAPRPTAPDTFEDWYANLLWIDRRKCLLITESKTLFTFLVAGIRRRDLMSFGELISVHLAETLFAHGVDLNLVPTLRTVPTIEFAKTSDRRILGSMNEYAFLYKSHIAHMGGLGRVDVLALNKAMNETPMGTLRYDSAIEAVKSELGRLAI